MENSGLKNVRTSPARSFSSVDFSISVWRGAERLVRCNGKSDEEHGG